MKKSDFYTNTPMGVSFEKFRMMADHFNIDLRSEQDYRCMVVSEHQMEDIYFKVETEGLPTLYFIRGKGRVSKEDFDTWYKNACEVRDTLFLTLNQIQQGSDFESCDRFRLTNTLSNEVISEGNALVPQGKYTIEFNWDGLQPDDFAWNNYIVPEWQEEEMKIIVDAKGGWQYENSATYRPPSLWQKVKNFITSPLST